MPRAEGRQEGTEPRADTRFGHDDGADVVVVGDLLPDEGVDAVRETVEGARDAGVARERTQ